MTAARSHALFNRARRLFARERNQVWLGLLDFYEAHALFRDARYARAAKLCEQARRQFEQTLLPGKAALCDLLLSRLALQSGNAAAGRAGVRRRVREAGRRRDADVGLPGTLRAWPAARGARRTGAGLCRVSAGRRQPRAAPQPFAVGVAPRRLPRRQGGRLRAPRHDVPHLGPGRMPPTRRRSATSSRPSHAAWRISSPFARSTSRRVPPARRATRCAGCGRS